MRKLAVLFSLFFLLSLQDSIGQTKGDTVLYLLHEPGKNYRGELSQIYPEENVILMENSYVFYGPLFDGFPLRFLSYKRELNARTLSRRELKQLPLVTVDQLNNFLKANYPQHNRSYGYEGGDYFAKLKKIYIVECVNRRKATVTEVVWNITRE